MAITVILQVDDGIKELDSRRIHKLRRTLKRGVDLEGLTVTQLTVEDENGKIHNNN